MLYSGTVLGLREEGKEGTGELKRDEGTTRRVFRLFRSHHSDQSSKSVKIQREDTSGVSETIKTRPVSIRCDPREKERERGKKKKKVEGNYSAWRSTSPKTMLL